MIRLIKPAPPWMGVIVVVAPEDLHSFKEVVRRGMSFEHGEGASLHQFADDLAQIKSSPTTPGDLPSP